MFCKGDGTVSSVCDYLTCGIESCNKYMAQIKDTEFSRTYKYISYNYQCTPYAG